MAEKTAIQWCNFTLNPWSGCSKIAPECEKCYAAVNYSVKMRGVKWGPEKAGGNRIVAAESMWKMPVKWNRDAAKDPLFGIPGEWSRPRVFCASLADVFEDWKGPMLNAKKEPLFRDTLKGGPWTTGYTKIGTPDRSPGAFSVLTMADCRTRLFRLIDDTPNLDWLLLTKRPENVERMMPTNTFVAFDRVQSTEKPRPNVWLGTTVGHRSRLGSIDVLRTIPAAVRFLSVEPLLEDLGPLDLSGIHWVIVGGESGPSSRACRIEWIRNVVDQCRAQAVAVFVKQFGAHVLASNPIDPIDQFPNDAIPRFRQGPDENTALIQLNDKKGGDMEEWPEDLRIREFPKCATVAQS